MVPGRGIYIVCAIGSYFYEHDQWTWRGLFLSTWPTVIVYGFTWIDHRITKRIAGDLPPVENKKESDE
jgi:hypothetical protein